MIAEPSPSPVPRRRPNPLVRLFASIRFGVTLLALIFIYSSIVSAVAPVRWATEMTEMQAFRHWLFVTLIVLFCVSLITATVTRIRFTWLNAGVLTVHTGLLLLAGGAIWYFGTKIEGDLRLQAPRVELIGLNSQGRWQGLAEVASEKGQVWEAPLPAFGGNVRLNVLDAQGGGMEGTRETTVRVEVGGGTPQTVTLAANATPQRVSDRLAVRLRAFPPMTRFYDDRPALYYRKVGATEQTTAAIRGLPLYKERYLDEGYVLHDPAGRPTPSHRVRPEIAWRSGASEYYIPTGWFERWKLPIPLETPGLPFDVEVTGYIPYISFEENGEPREEWILSGDEPQENPAVQVSFAAGGVTLKEPLFAFDPVRSLFSKAVFPIEFRWVADETQRDALLKPLAGPHELEIEVRDPPVKKIVAITQGQTIAVEGTPYKLTVKTLSAEWPLITPGFQGAVTPAASIDVTNSQKSYNRTVIQRFPQLSQDIDEQGVRRREELYDPNLILRYRSCPQGWVMLAAGPNLPPMLGIFDANGAAARVPVEVGRARPVKILGVDVTFKLHALQRNARALVVPVVEPQETRRPDLGLWSVSAIRLKLAGKGEYAGWSESRWCYYSMYPLPDSAGQPIRVRPQRTDGKAAEEWELTYSRLNRDLGASLALQKYSVKWFPGRQSVDTYRSDILVQNKPGEGPLAATVQTNETYMVGPWALFQSGEDFEQHWRYTILGVGTRQGIWPMTAGCILIAVGCLYAFYVKPVLRRRMKEQALAEAQARGVLRAPGPTTSAEVDMVEVER